MSEIVVCIVLVIVLGVHGVTVAGSRIQPGRTSHLIGRDGLCLDVFGGFSDDHVPTQLWPCGSQRNQLWTVQTDGTIRTMGKCLIPYSNSVGDYTMINDCYKSSADAKTWKIFPDGTVVHVHSGLVLTSKTAGQHSITTIEKNEYAASQGWDASDDLNPTVTKIVGLDGMCLHAQDDNRRVWLNACDEDIERKKWAIYGDSTIRAYFNTGLCLTSAGTSSDDLISLSACDGSVSQRWNIKDDGTVVNPRASLVMDVRGSDPSLHQIILYAPNGNPNQKWTFLT